MHDIPYSYCNFSYFKDIRSNHSIVVAHPCSQYCSDHLGIIGVNHTLSYCMVGEIMPNKRPIPKVDLTPYLEQDILRVNPKPDLRELHIEVGKDRCRTIVLNDVEALGVILRIIKYGREVWGDSLEGKLMVEIEKL